MNFGGQILSLSTLRGFTGVFEGFASDFESTGQPRRRWHFFHRQNASTITCAVRIRSSIVSGYTVA